ncbi:MAG TPA: DNA polymerase III subunit beta [Candidatus Paceibacterota bacterium]
MQAVVMREHLKEGLGIVERAVGRNPSLAILQNVLAVAEENKIKLAATDLQIGVMCEFLANTTQKGGVVFAPRFMSPLLSAIGEQHISLQGREGGLEVTAGGFHTTLRTANADEFPIIPTPKEADLFVEIQASALCKGLSQVVGMVGQSQARPEIGGIFFVFEKELLRVVATDSFRLAEKKIVFEKPNEKEQSFILPQRTAKELLSIFSERQGVIKVYISPSQAAFDYANQEEALPLRIQVVSRLIDGEYPDYQNVIPKDHKTKVVLVKDEFIAHVKAASVFAGKTSELALVVDALKKTVSCNSKSVEAGENHSSLEAEVTGQNVAVAFNWRFLLEGLLQMKDSRCELMLNGEDGPALLRPGGQQGYVYVIMPIKA